ncbi:hypothetical protein VTI74DRAFT_5075 [Chaetomium olivicolor]
MEESVSSSPRAGHVDQTWEVRNIPEQALAPTAIVLLRVVDGTKLFLAHVDAAIFLIRKLLASEDHRNADAGQQSCRSQRAALLDVPDTVADKEVVQPLIAVPFDVVQCDVVDRLGTVREIRPVKVIQPAVNQLADCALQVVTTRRLALDDGPQSSLPGFVPEGVENPMLDH